MSIMSMPSRLNDQTDMNMIINSSQGKDLLPSSYINNDFDGLFENENPPSFHDENFNCDRSGNRTSSNDHRRDLIKASCSSSSALQSTFKRGPSRSLGGLPQTQKRRREQENLNRTAFDMDQELPPQQNGDDEDHKKKQQVMRSLLIQQHLERARLSLQRADASDLLKSNANALAGAGRGHGHSYLNLQTSTVSASVSASNEDECSTSTESSSGFEQQPKELNGFFQPGQDSDRFRTPFQENNIITTPLMSQMFKSSKNNQEVQVQFQDHRQDKKRNIESTRGTSTSFSKSLVFDLSDKRPKKKRCYNKNTFSFKTTSHRYVKTVASQLPRSQGGKNSCSLESPPLETYMKVLKSGLYNTSYFESSSRYHSRPSELQKASFGNAIIDTVHKRDCKSLKKLISCGLSPNPCNQFGDSVLNTVCKRGHEDLFHALMDCGASVLTCDNFGRTPLHFVCWSSDFCTSVVEKILSIDVHMLRATDKVGKTPLDYVSRENWESWRAFLEEKKDIFWPQKSSTCTVTEDDCIDTGNGEHQERGSSLPDPQNSLSEDIAKLLSSGSLTVHDLEMNFPNN